MAVIIPIISEWNAKGLNKSMADIQKAGSKFDKFSLGIQKASKTASIGLVGLTAVGLSFAKSAADDAQAAAVFANTLKNTTKATDAQVASVEDWITAQGQLLGVTDDQLRPALGKLVTATKDVSIAQDLAATAMDIAAAKGIPLESVAQTLSKAYAGNFNALKKLVPGISEAALESGNWATIQAELNSLVGGSAATAADTAAGKYAIMQTQINEAKESIGAGLLPVIEKLIPQLTKMSTLLQANSSTVGNVGVGVAVFAASIVALNYAIIAATVTIKVFSAVAAATRLIMLTVAAATGSAAAAQTIAEMTYKRSTAAVIAYKVAMIAQRGVTIAATVAQTALNVALSLNPIGLIVLAIAAFVAALVLAYKKSDAFRGMVNSLWEMLKNVGNFIKNVLIGYFELWLTIINKVKDAVKSVIDKLNPFKNFFGGSTTVSQNLNVNSASGVSSNALKSPSAVIVNDEILARSISRILAKSDLRNGSTIGFA